MTAIRKSAAFWLAIGWIGFAVLPWYFEISALSPAGSGLAIGLAGGVLSETECSSSDNGKGDCRQTPASLPARNAAVGVPTTSDHVGATKAVEHDSLCLHASGVGRKLSANGIVDMRGHFIDQAFAAPTRTA